MRKRRADKISYEGLADNWSCTNVEDEKLKSSTFVICCFVPPESWNEVEMDYGKESI